VHHEVLASFPGLLRATLQPAFQEIQTGRRHQAAHARFDPVAQLAQALAGRHRYLLHTQDVAGIDPGIHEMDRHSNLVWATFEQRPLDHIHAAVRRQDARMTVHHTCSGVVEHVLADQAAAGKDHQIRFYVFQAFDNQRIV